MAAGTCFHCGEPLAAEAVTAQVAGAAQAFCCHGCSAAACWIGEAGLADYYTLRTAAGLRADPELPDHAAWDREDVLAGHSLVDGEGRRITVVVEGIRCAACAWLIGRALSGLPGVLEAEANAVTGRLQLHWDPKRTPLSTVLDRLAALGYRPHLATGEATEQARRAERRDLLKRLAVAGIGTLQAMMFAEALYLDFHRTMPEATRDALRWLTMAVSAPVVFYAGRPFLAGMANELRLRRFGMDTLIATSVLLAWLASVVETVRGGPHVWYDAAVMFVLFLLVARYLERMARQRAQSTVDALARARPALAWREGSGGGVAQVPLHALAAGDTVQVRAGEVVPADGVLLGAAAELDEALLTGESRPVLRAAGDTVLAGSLAVAQGLRMRVTGTGEDTVLSDLLRLVERAQAQRPRAARLADAVAGRFVLGLIACAVAIAAVWWRIEPERAFEVTLAMLIISCPCALSLAIPAALAAAHARLAGIGVLVLRADALDVLARVDTVLLDKTGTLSTGQFRLAAVEPCADLDAAQALAIAAALERHSPHPIASAFAGIEAPAANAVRVIAGAGIEGEVDGQAWRLGRAGFAAEGMPASDADETGVWLGDGRRLVARFRLGDRLRDDAAEACARLRAQGLALELASGDAPDAVAAAARSLAIPVHAARQQPQDKLARVRDLQAQGRVVAMLGDGVNDAPVLAGADVSVALASGAPSAHRAADVVLMGGNLVRLPQTLAVARSTRRVVRQNLAWALAYNLVALPVAALGLVTPWLAALGMALSSLLVTGNALRLAGSGSARAPEGAPARGAAPTPRPAPGLSG
ncbi:MAG: cadmium-translocating P-type ATPase [Xanthomonadales bacterium]|nr:cadmium-translocating P-type ATPase [Xanthomonadales bacterium]